MPAAYLISDIATKPSTKEVAAHNTELLQLDEAAVKRFCNLLQEQWDKYQAQQGYKFRTAYSYEYLKTYVRVYKYDDWNPEAKTKEEREKNKSLYAFIDCKGNIHKGSWKAPVKNGIRGNIFNTNPLQGMSIYGPEYLR